MVHYGKCKSDVLTIFIETTMHLVLPPPPQKKRLHNHCFQFLMGIIDVPIEIEGNCCEKFCGGGGGGGYKKRLLVYVKIMNI